jgi:hypothetical protein
MLYRFYVHDEKIIIPTVKQTEEGFYVDEKPVQVFAVKDTAVWAAELATALMSSNKVIPTPDPSSSGESVVLESLRIQKWVVFEKRACMYTIHATSSFIKLYRTGKAPDGMWGNNNAGERIFDAKAPVNIIVDALAEDVFRQPEAYPVKSGSLMVLPKPS